MGFLRREGFDTSRFSIKSSNRGPSYMSLQGQQPTRTELLRLHSALKGEYSFAEVELALDLGFPTPRDAKQADCWFRTTFVRRWVRIFNGLFPIKYCSYSNRRSLEVTNNVTYSTRDSKILKIPCLHIECRFRGKRAIANQIHVSTIPDLLSMNPSQFWPKRLQFFSVDYRALGRNLRGSPKAKQPEACSTSKRFPSYDLDLRRADIFVTRAMAKYWISDQMVEDYPVVPAAVLRQALKDQGRNPTAAIFKHIDHLFWELVPLPTVMT